MSESATKDPVCGMTVDPAKSSHSHEHAGQIYHFCAERCRARFADDPESFLNPAPAAPVKPGARYTCPMHPDVVQIGPGDCPVCGMALEPMNVFDASPEEDPELRRMSVRFWVSVIFAAPLLFLAMSDMIVIALLEGNTYGITRRNSAAMIQGNASRKVNHAVPPLAFRDLSVIRHAFQRDHAGGPQGPPPSEHRAGSVRSAARTESTSPEARFPTYPRVVPSLWPAG